MHSSISKNRSSCKSLMLVLPISPSPSNFMYKKSARRRMETRFDYIVPKFQNLKIFSSGYMGTHAARGPLGAVGGGWPADPVPAPPYKPLPYYTIHHFMRRNTLHICIYVYVYVGPADPLPGQWLPDPGCFFGPLFRLLIAAVFC